ncbi:MAG: hypothetical protein JWO28_1027 [Hyphomicrobiales bacterium]|nr:hypothetical protein [Hyphomicrobiales bacterium]
MLLKTPRRVVRPAKAIFSIGVAITVWVAPCSLAQADDGNLPADVLEFVGRRGSCDWSRKATDPQQSEQIDKIMRSLKCADINGDEQALRTSYADNPGVIAALNATWVKVVKRVPSQVQPEALPSGSSH